MNPILPAGFRSNRPAQPRVSVIIPALNEARNLEVVLPQLPTVHEVILIDGNSVDDTVEAAQRVLPDIQVIRQQRRGKGNALAHGFRAATGDVLVMFDADGSADPAEIPLFVDVLRAGADFAKGTRFAEGGGSADITAIRRLGNAGLSYLVNRLLRSHFTDLCYGFNAFWSDVLPVLDLADPFAIADGPDMVWGDGFEIETLINYRVSAAGLAITEVPSIERSRIFGVSNLSAVRDGLRVLRTIGAERRRAQALLGARTAADVATLTESLGEALGTHPKVSSSAHPKSIVGRVSDVASLASAE